MMEERTLGPDDPFPFTTEWYREREHAPHLEQSVHQPRMHAVAALASDAVDRFGIDSIVDLGAGDGGMLSLLAMTGVPCWGYDINPPNVRYAHEERQVDVRFGDFTTEDIEWGQLAIMTEVLEHLDDPHGVLRNVAAHCDFLIASSPASETVENHDASHVWTWDQEGYHELLRGSGFQVIEDQFVGGGYDFQVIFAMAV